MTQTGTTPDGGLQHKIQGSYVKVMAENGFLNLKGHIAVVAGVSPDACIRQGARVAILDLNEDTAKSVARSIGGVAVKM